MLLGVAAYHVFVLLGKKELVGAPAATHAEILPSSVLAAPVGGRRNEGIRACTTGSISNWADLDASEDNSVLAGSWTRQIRLLLRRNIAAGDLAFFSHGVPSTRP